MSTKLALAVAAAVAVAPALHAAPSAPLPVAPSAVIEGNNVLPMSDAARDQILDKSNLHLAQFMPGTGLTGLRRGAFVQENGPSWVQWRAQSKVSQPLGSYPAPNGNVGSAYRNLMR